MPGMWHMAQLNKASIEQAMQEMDDDNNGEVSFEEFNAWWSVRTLAHTAVHIPRHCVEYAAQLLHALS